MSSGGPVNEEAVAAGVGASIRLARRAAQLSTRELAARTGVSQAMISTIENNRTTPSISTLFRLAEALDVRPQSLLPEVGDPRVTVIRDAAVPVRMSDGSVGNDGRLLVSGADRVMEVVEYWIDPGEGAEFSHPGEELVRVLTGVVEVHLGPPLDQVEVLRSGEMIHYASLIPHRWLAVGDEVATVLLVSATPRGDQVHGGRPGRRDDSVD